MRMDWKKGKGLGLTVDHSPDHRLLCDPWPCAEAHPDHYGDNEVECEPLVSLGLVFIAISRLASLSAESHIDLLKVLGQA